MRIDLFYDKTESCCKCYVFRVTLVTVSRMPITHTLKNESRNEAFFQIEFANTVKTYLFLLAERVVNALRRLSSPRGLCPTFLTPSNPNSDSLVGTQPYFLYEIYFKRYFKGFAFLISNQMIYIFAMLQTKMFSMCLHNRSWLQMFEKTNDQLVVAD